MEYLSLPHWRAASHKLAPEVDDELVTNLRNPIITFVEDTSPGAHDTLTAACDANQYAALGVDKPAEHGSCAENLVLALKEINETAGLTGPKAIGSDITVNIAPTPFHLFMNAPLKAEGTSHGDGGGTKGVTLSVEEPKGKKRCFVRFRAERDVVVVLSACPMDVGKQNGGRCMAANFMVEDAQEGEDLASSVSKAKKAPKKLGQKGKSNEKKEEPKKDETGEKQEEPKKEEVAEKKKAPKKLTRTDTTDKKQEEPKKEDAEEVKPAAKRESAAPPKEEKKTEEELKPKKKPKKLQVSSQTPTQAS